MTQVPFLKYPSFIIFLSGEDWEEEPEGEKISDDEKLSGKLPAVVYFLIRFCLDEEDMDEEDQDGFFVPHGYLSDDEANAARDPDGTLQLWQSSV